MSAGKETMGGASNCASILSAHILAVALQALSYSQTEENATVSKS